jgi:hypothetical protein
LPLETSTWRGNHFSKFRKSIQAVTEALCGLARIHYDLDHYQEALNDYCLALEKSPYRFFSNSVEFSNLSGRIH